MKEGLYSCSSQSIQPMVGVCLVHVHFLGNVISSSLSGVHSWPSQRMPGLYALGDRQSLYHQLIFTVFSHEENWIIESGKGNIGRPGGRQPISTDRDGSHSVVIPREGAAGWEAPCWSEEGEVGALKLTPNSAPVSCATLGKLLHLSAPQSPPCYTGPLHRCCVLL